jgi:hypothetical protein
VASPARSPAGARQTYCRAPADPRSPPGADRPARRGGRGAAPRGARARRRPRGTPGRARTTHPQRGALARAPGRPLPGRRPRFRGPGRSRAARHDRGLIGLAPAAPRRTRHAAIVRDRLALAPSPRHAARRRPVAAAAIRGRWAELVPVRLVRGRQPDPPHRFPPLVKNCPRGSRKKEARSSAACIRLTLYALCNMRQYTPTMFKSWRDSMSTATLAPRGIRTLLTIQQFSERHRAFTPGDSASCCSAGRKTV